MMQIASRRADVADAPEVARLLHDFNTEFCDPSPGAARGTRGLIATGEMAVPLAGEGPDGMAALRFRPSFWSGALDAYLEDLYGAPRQRGRGLGRSVLEAALQLGTNEDDTAARAFYESCGFSDRESGPDDPTMLSYEREL